MHDDPSTKAPSHARWSPAFARNRDPILGVLRACWPASQPRHVLELASGPGQHVCYFAAALPHIVWQPSDGDATMLPSINAWRAETHVENIRAPLHLDVRGAWPTPSSRREERAPVSSELPAAREAVRRYDGAVMINLLHMVDAQTVRAAFLGLGRTLRAGACVVVYDCFTFDGAHVSPSNARFDAQLRATTPGRVYAFERVDGFAREAGFERYDVHWLPANNQGIVWFKGA